MTHPLRAPHSQITVADAMRAISDCEMTEMCLAVNIQMGTPAANRLLELFGAARREANKPDPLADALNSGDGSYRP